MSRRRRSPFRVDVDLLGDKALSKALRDAPKEVERKILPKALRAGAKPVLQAAKALVPVDRGVLKKSLKSRKGRTRRRGPGKVLQHRVFTGNAKDLGIKPIKNPGSRGGKTTPGFYPMAIEAGYVRQDGVRIPPRSYLRAALHEERETAKAAIRRELWSGLEKYARGELKVRIK